MSLMNVHITLLWDTPHNKTTGTYRYKVCISIISHKKLYPDSFLNTKKINCSWSISVAGWNSQKLNHPKKQKCLS